VPNPTAVQVHCPFCNGVQAVQADGNYTCDFCLQPFSIVQAQKEETRLLEEIRGWLDKRIGSAGAAASGVDASSRSYIFQQRILPDLRREVDRALEVVGSYGQFQLVPVPVPAPSPTGRGINPLVASRKDILALKNLRARLQSEYIRSFAIGEDDQAVVQSLDRRLAEIMGLSNVADAANRRDTNGYATARRNLGAVLTEIGESLGMETNPDPTFKPFLAALQERYKGLVELCRICEEVSSPNAVSGASLADRAEAIAATLRQAARAVEASQYSPADAMPVVISTQGEAVSAEYLARWLRTYDSLASKSLQPFPRFVGELSAVVHGGKHTAEAATELAEGCAWLVRVVRGEIAVPVYEDHSWGDGWVEGARAKKSLGVFGAEERVTYILHFMLPVWVADISFSKSTGAVFKEGVEAKCVGLVEATAPSAAKACFLHDRTSSLAQALDFPRVLSRRSVALPGSTAKAAEQALKLACSSRLDMLQAQIRLRGIAFLPAVYAYYESKKGNRALAACAGGQVPVEPGVHASIQSAGEVLRQFA
jgi:hypothetical protein